MRFESFLSIKEMIAAITTSLGYATGEKKEQAKHVTCVEIDRIRRPVPSVYLTVGYVNGYEVHHISSERSDETVCVCSFTGGDAVGLIRLLPSSVSSPRNAAVVYKSSPSVVRFVDMCTNESYHLLRMTAPVLAIRASVTAIVVSVDSNRIHIYNSESLEEILSTDCSVSGVFALHDRWLAYNVSPLSKENHPPAVMGQVWNKISTISQDAFDNILMAVANRASGHPSDEPSPAPLQSPVKVSRETRHGVVAIRDVVSLKNIASVEDQLSRPLELIEWSNCGRMLLTTSGNGHQVIVYELSSSREIAWEVKLVLNRGVTPAVITSLSIDSHSRFAAVCSNKGTVHVFSMSPETRLEERKFKISDSIAPPPDPKAYFDFKGNLVTVNQSHITLQSIKDGSVIHTSGFVRPVNGSPNLGLKSFLQPIPSKQSVDVKTCPDLPLPLWLSPQLSFWSKDAEGQLTQLKVTPPGSSKIQIESEIDPHEYSAAIESALNTPLTDQESATLHRTSHNYFINPRADGFVQIVEDISG